MSKIILKVSNRNNSFMTRFAAHSQDNEVSQRDIKECTSYELYIY